MSTPRTKWPPLLVVIQETDPAYDNRKHVFTMAEYEVIAAKWNEARREAVPSGYVRR